MNKEKLTAGQQVINESNAFREYYADDIKWLENQLKKLEDLDKIINDEITKITQFNNSPKSGMLLATYMENYINLNAQKQSCAQAIINLKKSILDYSIKTKSKDNDSADDMVNAVKILRQIVKTPTDRTVDSGHMSDEDLDKAIDSNLED